MIDYKRWIDLCEELYAKRLYTVRMVLNLDTGKWWEEGRTEYNSETWRTMADDAEKVYCLFMGGENTLMRLMTEPGVKW